MRDLRCPGVLLWKNALKIECGKGEEKMAKEKKLVQSITSRDEDFAQWYTDVVREAKLCDYSGVKGCLNYLPNGYALWENIQADLDKRFKDTGVENVYLPVLIPESLLQKEKDHIEGFAPEVAWVTHGGMEQLQERFCIRPTSETLFCGAKQFSHTVTCRKYGINGVLCCAGRRQRDRSSAPESSCGRRDIRSTQHTRKRKNAQR